MAARIFKRLSVKTPAELAQKAHQAFVRLPYESSQERIVDELARLLAGIKECMFGEDEEHASKENALTIAHEACRSDLVGEMIECLPMLEFESRKDVTSIFSAILRIEDQDGSMPGLIYMKNHLELIYSLFEGYERPEIALCCGQMFRECIRHEELAKLVINDSELFRDLFAKMDLDVFEIASDAFLTLKDILTRHKSLVSIYLTEHYDDFLENYRTLLESSNYVTRRQSVKLLGELLLDRSNVKAMMMYVSDVGNLKLMMNLLKDSSKSIQFEAFHVFKVFVANPNKTRPVTEVLLNNKEKLLEYLETFQSEREDPQFQEEKAVIIREIADLKALPPE